MKQDELINIYNEIEYNWEEYNRISEILNKEKEYIKNYNYKKHKFSLKTKIIINFIKSLIFKSLILILLSNFVDNIINLTSIIPNITTFVNTAIVTYSLMSEYIKNKSYYKNNLERIENEIMSKMEYINELSTKKLEIKNRIYELSDKINICDNSLSKDNSESKIDLKDEKIQKIEPYIIYEQKEKVLKREINRSINKRSIYYK